MKLVGGVNGVVAAVLPGALDAQRHRLGECSVVYGSDLSVDIGAVRRGTGDRGSDRRFFAVQRHERLMGDGLLLHQRETQDEGQRAGAEKRHASAADTEHSGSERKKSAPHPWQRLSAAQPQPENERDDCRAEWPLNRIDAHGMLLFRR